MREGSEGVSVGVREGRTELREAWTELREVSVGQTKLREVSVGQTELREGRTELRK